MESGPFITTKSMPTDQATEFLGKAKDNAFAHDGGILLKNGQVVGSGTTVNIDFGFFHPCYHL